MWYTRPPPNFGQHCILTISPQFKTHICASFLSKPQYSHLIGSGKYFDVNAFLQLHKSKSFISFKLSQSQHFGFQFNDIKFFK